MFIIGNTSNPMAAIPSINYDIKKNTVNKLISWVSSAFKVTEESLINTFEDETHTFINPMEQLLVADKDLMEELEQEYQ